MKVKVLDGLRGYSALMIILAHSPQVSNSLIGHSLRTLISASKIGYLGVDIFFVLSGFLITRILIREKKEGNFSFKRFYIKRSLRIFPIYFLTVIICGLLFTWEGVEYTSTFLSNYYFSFNNSAHPLRHTWSLAVEEHYYLFWPLIIHFFSSENIRKYYLTIICATIIISLFLLFSYFDSIITDSIIYRMTNFRILSISIGSTFAFNEQGLISQSKKQSIVKLLLIFISLYCLSILVHKTILVDLLPKSVLTLFLFSIISSILFVIVLKIENSKSLMNFLFTNKAIVFIGKISYGIYIFHYPIFYFFEITSNQLAGKWITLSEFIAPISLVFLLPIFSYYIIEKPLLNYKNKTLIITQNKG